ncbi:Gpi18p [Malassezia vespertilionis]|uniref:GPI mannosyltransferase 2 n=1 Tax=Malassezia vespertilionis TaxID=2020962 RepID=A0A2N1JG12_9BASI|nr:Gpi18p [Malassezia vespertilionis]
MRPWAWILGVSAAWRVVCVLLLVLAAQVQQAFDTSGSLVLYSLGADAEHAVWEAFAVPFVRWDTVYFLAASHPQVGYAYEQMLAFQPGLVALLRTLGFVPRMLYASTAWSPTAAVILGALLSNLLSWLAPLLLYTVTMQQTHSQQFALVSALLSIFAPASSAALSAPTPESFYSFFALLGFALLGTRSCASLILASFAFMVATCFRANGVMLAGFILWYCAWAHPGSARRFFVRLVTALPLMLVVMGPFITGQAWAYARLCTLSEAPPWCAARIPIPYSWIQSHYWNVGFLRYWTLQQLPNFLLAVPMLVLGAAGCMLYVRTVKLRPLLRSTFTPWNPRAFSADPFGRIAPAFVYHTAILLAVLLFASHVQIILRLATPGGMPILCTACVMAYLACTLFTNL